MATKTLLYPRLTAQRYRLLDMIAVWWEDHGYAPSARDLMEGMHYASVSTAHDHLGILRDQGMVEWEAGRSRTVRLTRQGKAALIEQRVL